MNILIVDDNAQNLYLLQVLLGGHGYQVVSAAHGAEALAAARLNPPGLVISDILMPVMDGFSLCREWKKDPRLRSIPFIFYTATYTDERDRKFALSLGAEHFMVKPEEPEIFLRAVREVIQRVHPAPAAGAAPAADGAPPDGESGYLKQYNEVLIHKLEHKMEALEKANRELKELVFAASHDLRSPLVNIQGFCRELDLALREMSRLALSPGIPEEIREKMKMIIQTDIGEAQQYVMTSAVKMDALLNGLLRISRLGRVDLDVGPLDMNTLLAGVRDGLQFLINQTGATVEIPPVPGCRGDALQVNLVFSGLLDNALKYRRPGRPAMIKFSGHGQDGFSVYCVEDNGPGLAPEHYESIFELFHRLDPSPGAPPGEGLGLAIARRILNRLHGKIWVESELSKGSKFYVQLPSA